MELHPKPKASQKIEAVDQTESHAELAAYSEPLKISNALKSLLAKPLIVGASVSANHRGIASPGRQLALRATTSAEIHTVAKSGKPAREVLQKFSEDDLKDRTIVIGTDLLFWDSTQPAISESIEMFRKFVQAIIAREIPLVLGEVPGFFPAMQTHWKLLNEEIRVVEKNYSKCVILPFDKIYHQILDEGSFRHRGMEYTIHELVPDGLHLSTLAGKVLADLMQDLLTKKLATW
jgi:hypothetical protein